MIKQIAVVALLALSVLFIFLGSTQAVHVSDFTIAVLFGVSIFAAAWVLKENMKE